MLIRNAEDEYEICPSLKIIICKLVAYCDDFNLPLNIIESNEWSLKFSTIGFTEQLIYKYIYTTNKNFSDIGLKGIPLCILKGNCIEVTVDADKDIKKFSKERK